MLRELQRPIMKCFSMMRLSWMHCKGWSARVHMQCFYQIERGFCAIPDRKESMPARIPPRPR